MGIGERIRQRRMELNISRNQLANLVHVTPSAIANYENSVSYPKPDIFIALAIALDVDANYLFRDLLLGSFGTNGRCLELTDEEKIAITKYHELPPAGKHLVQMVIDEEHTRAQKEGWVEFPCMFPGLRKKNSGFLLSDFPRVIRIKQKHVVPDMDFCFQIQLDRYAPVFKKYDILALSRTPAAHNEMGIFCLNGIYYIRMLYQTEHTRILCSLNVIDSDIYVTEEDSFECIGKIIDHIYGDYEIQGDTPSSFN